MSLLTFSSFSRRRTPVLSSSDRALLAFVLAPFVVAPLPFPCPFACKFTAPQGATQQGNASLEGLHSAPTFVVTNFCRCTHPARQRDMQEEKPSGKKLCLPSAHCKTTSLPSISGVTRSLTMTWQVNLPSLSASRLCVQDQKINICSQALCRCWKRPQLAGLVGAAAAPLELRQ